MVMYLCRNLHFYIYEGCLICSLTMYEYRNAPIAESAANNETCKFKATAVGAYPRFEASLFSFVLPFFSLLLLPLI